MEIQQVSESEYTQSIRGFTTVFDTPKFHHVNKGNCEAILFLLCKSGKIKFGIVGGKVGNEFRMPFSAPYACMTPYRKDLKLFDYCQMIKTLVDFLRDRAFDKIMITLPPLFYDVNHLSSLSQTLNQFGFNIEHIDLNYHYNLEKFGENYLADIDPKARQKLKAGMNNNFEFSLVNSLAQKKLVYSVIQANREHKGFPLRLSFERLLTTESVIKVDYFLLEHGPSKQAAASCICFHVTNKVIQIIYWGDAPDMNEYKPMNYLAYKIFDYYKNSAVEIIDIGPSTESGIQNFGLCDYKQSIGCETALKFCFSKNIKHAAYP